MKILLLTLFLIPFLSSAQLDCSKFVNGRFVYPLNPSKLSVRKDAVQKSYTNGKLDGIWKVEWLGECKLKLTCTKTKNTPAGFKKGDIVLCDIISIKGKCFEISAFMIRGGVQMGGENTGMMCMEE